VRALGEDGQKGSDMITVHHLSDSRSQRIPKRHHLDSALRALLDQKMERCA
jgi:hypothetical protein